MATFERMSAFSVGHSRILHANSMFGKFRRARGCCMHVVLVIKRDHYPMPSAETVMS
jgi:hypothetical protein